MPNAQKLFILILLAATAGCARGDQLPVDGSQVSFTAAPAAILPVEWTPTSPSSAQEGSHATPAAMQEPARETGSAEDSPPPVTLTPFDMGGSQDQPIVAFSSDREGNVEIYVMRLDGTGVRRLTENKAQDDNPRWSPDGFQLVFTSWRETDENPLGYSKVMLINADGSGERTLGIDRAALFPAWSPDGSFLAVAVTTDLGLYDANDGTLVRRLNQAIGILDRHPDFSPDGKFVAYTSHDNVAFKSDIYAIETSGTGRRLLMDAGKFDVTPAWSPDGEWLAFSSNDSGGVDYDLNLVRSDGSGLRTITQGFYPRWSPDGEWISFTRYDGMESDIYIIRPDGSDERRLTDSPGIDAYLDWRPVGDVREP